MMQLPDIYKLLENDYTMLIYSICPELKSRWPRSFENSTIPDARIINELGSGLMTKNHDLLTADIANKILAALYKKSFKLVSRESALVEFNKPR